MEPMIEYAQTLTNLAKSLGAENAQVFQISQIVFDSRTFLKCMFGCDDWKCGLTCPSANPNFTPAMYREMFERYRWGIIVHSHEKHISQDVSFALESRAFADGYYFAFSLSDCSICSECAGHDNKPCRNMKKARPAFHSVGIDVFATVRKFGLPIRTLKKTGDEENWYSALFVE